MNRLIETIRNIFKIEELRKRILFTVLIILVYRFGSFVVIPGVDPNQLSIIQRSSEGGLLGLLNMFSGGAFGNASIFALGIMPYITASIIIQLLGMAVPYFQRLQKEGESGRKKLNQIMRGLTVIIVAIQGPGYIKNVVTQFRMAGAATAVTPFDGSAPGVFFYISSVILLIAGTLFIMWLGEKITDRGIGNGISLIIMIGIIARLPGAFVAECAARFNQGGTGLLILVIELIVLFFVMVGTIALVQGTRKIPVQYAKRVVGNRQYGGVRQYIPLKVNAAGVMPIIFAQAIMFLPVTIAGFRQTETLTGIAAAFTNINGFWYNLVFFLMIIAFTYFYTAVTMNTNQMAEDIKKNGGFIPGVKPGKKTAEYLDTIMSRITLPGSLFLGLVAIMPAIVANLMNVTTGFSHFYGGTSLLILVGVVLDTLQQIESHLLMHHYDGLTKTGRIKGRIGRM
ncbi:MAG: preprotein translocase subunit SecY [Bacteroidales bacterium]|nr:preprotein translocase subunit SecY [Bacteroidales bacterium]